MIYSIVGEDAGLREKAYAALSKLGYAKEKVSDHLYHEHADKLKHYIDAADLFGDAIIVYVMQLMEVASSKELLISLLSDMQSSNTIFIIDEPFADVHKIKHLTKYSEEVFNAKGEKEKEVDVFTLCSLVAARNKKGAWIEWMKIKDVTTGEQVQGLLWWKWKTIWQAALSGKKQFFTQQECERFGKKLLYIPIKAHRGEGDIKLLIEEFILSI
jgi:hypothetical protein